MVAATSLAATAPLAAGLLLAWRGPVAAVLFFAAAVGGSALVATSAGASAGPNTAW